MQLNDLTTHCFQKPADGVDVLAENIPNRRRCLWLRQEKVNHPKDFAKCRRMAWASAVARERTRIECLQRCGANVSRSYCSIPASYWGPHNISGWKKTITSVTSNEYNCCEQSEHTPKEADQSTCTTDYSAFHR